MESARDEKTLRDSKVWNPPRPLPWEACFWLVFSTNAQRQIDWTDAFKSIFRNHSIKLCRKFAGFLGVLEGRAHACVRAFVSEKLRTTRFGTCRVPHHEALVRASGKDLAQGQVALIDPT